MLPFELFLPSPSLSTTSSAHLIRLLEAGSCSVEPSCLGRCSPLSLRVPVSLVLEGSTWVAADGVLLRPSRFWDMMSVCRMRGRFGFRLLIIIRIL